MRLGLIEGQLELGRFLALGFGGVGGGAVRTEHGQGDAAGEDCIADFHSLSPLTWLMVAKVGANGNSFSPRERQYTALPGV